MLESVSFSECALFSPLPIVTWERSPREGNGNPLQYSCLEKPMEEPGGLLFTGSQKSRTQLSNWMTTIVTWHFQRVPTTVWRCPVPEDSAVFLHVLLHWCQLCPSLQWKLDGQIESVHGARKGRSQCSQTNSPSKEDVHCADGDHYKSLPVFDLTKLY